MTRSGPSRARARGVGVDHATPPLVLLLALTAFVALPALARAGGTSESAAALARGIQLRMQARELDATDPGAARGARRDGERVLIALDESLRSEQDAAAVQLRRRALFHLAALQCEAGDLSRAGAELGTFRGLAPSAAESAQADVMWADCVRAHPRAEGRRRFARGIGPGMFAVGLGTAGVGLTSLTATLPPVVAEARTLVTQEAWDRRVAGLEVSRSLIVAGAATATVGAAVWVATDRARARRDRASPLLRVGLIPVPGGALVVGRF